jgi:uncharacterized damage-inducible protein DinB
MSADPVPLAEVFEGWAGYQYSLVEAVRPLTPEQLAWRPAPHLRPVGELAAHIAHGRVVIFSRVQAPLAAQLASQTAPDNPQDTLYGSAAALVRNLESSWGLIEEALNTWTAASHDLATTYRFTGGEQAFALSRQWNIWLMLTHDIHHGGELATLLSIQGITTPLLGDRFGHLAVPPLAQD